MALGLPNTTWGDGVFKCPAYKGVAYAGEGKFDNRGGLSAVYAPCGSYAYNASGRRDPVPSPSGMIRAGVGFVVNNGQAVEQPIRESEVRAPADLYVFGDAPLVTALWGIVATMRLGGAADYNMFIADRASIDKTQHYAVFNMVLADAHVESVRTQKLLGTDSAYRSRWNHDNQP